MRLTRGTERPPDDADDWRAAIHQAEEVASDHGLQPGRVTVPSGAGYRGGTGLRLGVGGLAVAFLAGAVLGAGASDRVSIAYRADRSAGATAGASLGSPAASVSAGDSGTPSTATPSSSPEPTARPTGPFPEAIGSILTLLPTEATRISVRPPDPPSTLWRISFAYPSLFDVERFMHTLGQEVTALGIFQVQEAFGQDLIGARLEGTGLWAMALGDGTIVITVDQRILVDANLQQIAPPDANTRLSELAGPMNCAEDPSPPRALSRVAEVLRSAASPMILFGGEMPQTSTAVEVCRAAIGEASGLVAGYLLWAWTSDGFGTMVRLADQLRAAHVAVHLHATVAGFALSPEFAAAANGIPFPNDLEWISWSTATSSSGLVCVIVPASALGADGAFLPTPGG